MERIFGMISLVIFVGIAVCLFSGEWLLAGVLFASLFPINLVGSRAVRRETGLSMSGRDGISALTRAEQALVNGDVQAALGSAMGAVRSFRSGGDREPLILALVILAAAQAAHRDLSAARGSLREVAERYAALPPSAAHELDFVPEVTRVVESAVDVGVPDVAGFIADFARVNADPT